ncbi:hypothetical protein [Nocardioides cynanchi]|uniref:hypothetical protein n=1 Tax=Nocardioides cynanchi TaxID=2558918 RepID=UPI0012466804|nr:hypothetical protein [Nocardioides cynanchi]
MSEPREPDDLAAWADDDLVRALRAPGTTTELADEAQVLAAFRAARPVTGIRSLPRRAAGRLGAGGTAVVVTVALTSGVAAAYTGNLPDPVQRVVHSVLGPIGAPAPDADRAATGAPTDPRHPNATGTTSPTAPGPTSSPTPSGTTPSAGPTASPTGAGHTRRRPGDGSSTGPTAGPGSEPTSGPSASSTPPTTTAAASGVTISGTGHRADVGEIVSLSGVVTGIDGTGLPAQRVVLQVRGPRRWRPVAEATSDDSGAVAFTTPALTRSARFRLRTDPHLRSAAWVVRMVPLLSTSALVGGTTTTINATCQGCRGGDRVELYRWVDHQPRLVRRGRLDPAGSAQVQVVSPQRNTRYAVRLLATRRHTAARAAVAVTPPAAASVSVEAASHRVLVGQSVTVSGVVRAADGSALPGRRVALQVRGPQRWRVVARAATDDAGSVSFATPLARRTTAYRLRTVTGTHSPAWRLAMMPLFDATASTGATTVTLTATAQGGRAGDQVVLLRRSGARLVRLRHGPLGADGAVTFVVSHRRLDTTYVVRLRGTRVHTPAVTQVTVTGTG